MKKYHITILFLSFLFSLPAQIPDSIRKARPVQHKWSIDFAAGYGFPIAGSVIGEENYNDDARSRNFTACELPFLILSQ